MRVSFVWLRAWLCLDRYLFAWKAESLKVNRMQVTGGGCGCLKCFTPCLSAMRPVSVCCQSYQCEWQCPQKVTAKPQYIWTINYPDNNNECYSWRVACYFITVQLTPSSVPRWHWSTLKPNQAFVVRPSVLKDVQKKLWLKITGQLEDPHK